ncbi:MAG: DUF4827 domain-containing protein [Paludibacteraceae bacterium]|nr:DUF4827 domain-containing protein [Paludibacteraceae bacterium]
MKRTSNYLLLALMIIVSGCTDKDARAYYKQRKAEKELIEQYIKEEGINVLTEEPEVYGEKDYYQVAGYDYFYFHLEQQGDTNTIVKKNETVIFRYQKYTLSKPADTISIWTTDEQGWPLTFRYGDTQDQQTCEAWHAAIKLMKYSGSTCKIICPSTLGFDDEIRNVIPYGYTLYFQVKAK